MYSSDELNISLKIIRIRGEVMLAACDREILGKYFEEGEFHIEVKEDFYHEVFVGRDTFVNALKTATIANLVGERVVKIAIEEGFVDEENVLRIQGIPYAQMVKLFI